MAVKIWLQFNGKQMIIPINPEKLQISSSASNDNIKVLGIGNATRKGEPSLRKLSIESFFPAVTSPFYHNFYSSDESERTQPPSYYIDFINEIWNTENVNNTVARIVTQGLTKDINMPFVIEDFDYNHEAGDDDVSYTLSIKEYRAYGVKLVDYDTSGMASSRATSPALEQNSNTNGLNTYTVQSGDCLWNISKACCGDGSRWRELYDLNKDVIGSNPNSIKSGQVLSLPSGWSTPTNVPKLKPVSKTNPPATTNKTIAVGTNGIVSVHETTDTERKAVKTLIDALQNGNVKSWDKMPTTPPTPTPVPTPTPRG